MNGLLIFAFIVLGFLSGSVMYCKIIPAIFAHKDVTAMSDDHNPGAYNVFAHCGKKMGVVCLLCDVLKAFIPVFAASFFVNTHSGWFAVIMAAPVLGHAAGMLNGFHGGKCIASSFGVMFGITKVTFIGIILLAALYILFSAIIKVKPNTKCSIIVYSCFLVFTAVIMNMLGMYAVAAGCGIISVTAIFKHLSPKLDREEVNDKNGNLR